MSKIRLAGIVTLYNPTDQDIKNIDTYLDDIDKLYIIDNTEGKDNKDRIPKSKKIDYKFKNENVGVATALNMGAKLAMKDGFDYLLTMDQDTVFKKGDIDALKKDIQTVDMTKIAIVTPWHKTKANSLKPMTKFDLPCEVMTSANILNLRIWKKLGGFKDWMFIDGIDIEFGLNAVSHGYYILRDNSIEVEHNLGNIFFRKLGRRNVLCTNHAAIRRYYIMRNNHYIYDMYFDKYPAYCQMLINQRHNILAVILFEKDKLKKLKMYRKGLKDYKEGIKGKYQSS